jgi:hypothetical protein
MSPTSPGIPIGMRPAGTSPGMPMPGGAPRPGMPGPGTSPGIPIGMRPADTSPGMPMPGGAPRPGMPAPGQPGMPMGMRPGTSPAIPIPGGAQRPGMPPPAGLPRAPMPGSMPMAAPGGAPGAPRTRDPFGLGAPATQAPPKPRAPMGEPLVDDHLPEQRGAEEISLDVGAPSAPMARARPTSGDGGEAQLRDALSKASKEVIEKIAWEVVPQLAETIIRQELDRLIKEREKNN